MKCWNKASVLLQKEKRHLKYKKKVLQWYFYSSSTLLITRAVSWQNQQNDCVPSEDSDQTDAQSDHSHRCVLNG